MRLEEIIRGEKEKKSLKDVIEEVRAERGEVRAAPPTAPSIPEGPEEPGLEEPGIIGTLLNPAEIATAIATGGISAARLGKPILKEMADWALYGAPSIYRGIRGGINALFGGLRAPALAREAVEAAPPSTPSPPVKSITELAREAILPKPPPPPEPLSPTSELLEAAKRTITPKPEKPGFLKSAEEILRKNVAERGVASATPPPSVEKIAAHEQAKQASSVLNRTVEEMEKAEKALATPTARRASHIDELKSLTERDWETISKYEPVVRSEDLVAPAKEVTGGADLNLSKVEETALKQGGWIERTLNWFKLRGIVDKELSLPKDFRPIYKYLQLPHDIAKTFPQFKPIFDTEMARTATRNAMIRKYHKLTIPYFEELSDLQRKAVDRVLLMGDRRGEVYTVEQLRGFGLDEKQIAAYNSIRTALDDILNDVIEMMRKVGVSEENIEKFSNKLIGYVPHKWYGKYGIVVRDPSTKKVIYVTAKESKAKAGEELLRLKREFSGHTVEMIPRNQIERTILEDIPPYAVKDLVERAAKRAAIDPEVARDLADALHDLNLSKGMGAHFIKRRGTPGFEEDLARPLAEYIVGMSGYTAKIEAISGFADGYKAISDLTPNLKRYARDYIKYVLNPDKEYAIGIAKSLMFHNYLGLNLKSALVNASQNWITGWPVLSKYTRNAGYVMTKAMFDTAMKRFAPDEVEFLRYMTDKGLLEREFTGALLPRRDPFAPVRTILDRTANISSFLFDTAEEFNRTSMALAAYRVLKSKGAAGSLDDMAKIAHNIMEEAHFIYARGDRPVAARGWLSPLMTFRLFTVNYFTLLKNMVKEHEWGGLARMFASMTALAGVGGWPLSGVIEEGYMHFTGKDLKTQIREWVKKGERGAVGDEYASKLALFATDGLPAAVVGVNLSRSIGMGDVIQLDPTAMIGAFGGEIERVAQAVKAAKLGEYKRAFETIAPEAIGQPMRAYRLLTEGAVTMKGQPIIDVKTGKQITLSPREAIVKALGFQPERYIEPMREVSVAFKQQQRLSSKAAEYGEAIAHAINNKDFKKVKSLTRMASKIHPELPRMAVNRAMNSIGPLMTPVMRAQMEQILGELPKVSVEEVAPERVPRFYLP